MKRLIDASALLEWMLGNVAFFVEKPSEVIDFIEFAIKAQPTVICVPNDLKNVPQVQHGQWIVNTKGGGYDCSNCGHHVDSSVGEMIDPRDYECYLDKYCGGCGAKMDGGVDNV